MTMPNDNQPAKSYIEAVMARADGATKGPWANDDPSWKALNDITVWSPNPDVSICNMGGAISACDDVSEAEQNFRNGEFVAHARQDIPTLAKIALRAIEALEEAVDEDCEYPEDDALALRMKAARALADINALAAKGSQ